MHECQMEPRMELDGFQENKAGADFINPNNISVCDLDEETNSKLRGDAIGDTLYSQSFVLKTLLQFSDLKWSEQVEDDLCFLWDMTMEKDVCKYLFQISFPSLACSALTECTESRLIEIIIGILANILCSDCDKNITEEQICIVLREMNTDDPLVLIQIVRFISAVVHISNELLFISEFELDKLKFILCNSTNNELLLKTLEVVAKLTTNFKLNKDLLDFEVILSSLSSYKLIITSEENNKFELATSEKQLACKHFLQVVSNVCAYIDRFENEHLLLQFKEHSNIFTVEVIKILNYYSIEENLLPFSDNFIFYMSAFRFVLEILYINYISELFFPLTKILCIIVDFKDDVMELFDSVLELECFLCSRCTPDLLKKDLKYLSKKTVRTFLNLITDNKQKCHLFNLDVQYLIDKNK